MSTLKVNNLQVGQDSTATNNLTWFQPGSPDGTIRLGSGNAGSATTKFTFDKDGNLTCVGNINAASILAPIEGTLDDWIVHAGDTNTKIGFPTDDTFTVETAGSERLRINSSGTAEFYGGEGSTPAIKVQSEGGGVGLFFGNFQGITDTGDSTRLGVGLNDNALIYMNASGSQVGCLAYGTTDAVPLVFSTSNTEKLRITSTGVVSINDSTPETWATLQVKNHTGASAAQFLLHGADSAQIILRDETGGTNTKCTTLRNDQGTLKIGTHNDAYGGFSEKLRIQSTGKSSFAYDATPANAQYGQIEISKSGASNADPDWSYLSFHRVGQIAWQQGIDSNAFVIASTGGGAKDTLDAEKLRIASDGEATFSAENININRNAGDPFIALQTSGTSNAVIYGGATTGLRGFTKPSGGSLTERVRITPDDCASFGNSSPPSWQTGGGYYNIQLGNAGYFRADTDASSNFLSYGVNAYRDGSGWKFTENGRATQLTYQDGKLTFHGSNSGNADGAITWAEHFKIDENGKLLIGKTRTQYTNDYYDDITINNSGGSGAAGGCGITMISNASSWGALQFGDPDDDDCGYIKYDHNQNKIIFGIEDGSVRYWQTKEKLWLGTTGHGDGSRSTLLDIVGANQDPIGAWGQMGLYSSDGIAQDKGGSITFGGHDGSVARQYFAGIHGAKENGTSGNYAGNLNFFTRPSGAVPVRRLRIESWGNITAWQGPSQHNGNPGRLAAGHIMTWNSTHMSGGLATGWYPIIHLTDGCYLFMLKTGAHSSILFTASNGYDPSNVSYINVLHYTNNRNSSYLNVDGLRNTSDGVVEVHLTASSSDYFYMEAQILGAENIQSNLGFYSTLTKNTGSPTVNDTKYPLTYSTGAMQLENVRIDGALDTGGSKNFRIPHPLSSLTGTKDLVHAAVEGPRADLIYRDKVDLVGGTATVNIDTVTGMTAGTFAVLTKNAQCFTTNETGWTNVKGSISGNILTITAQDNSCTDTISWMVVAQRKDANIISASATDSNGDLILEPPSPLVDTTGQAPDDSKPNEI